MYFIYTNYLLIVPLQPLRICWRVFLLFMINFKLIMGSIMGSLFVIIIGSILSCIRKPSLMIGNFDGLWGIFGGFWILGFLVMNLNPRVTSQGLRSFPISTTPRWNFTSFIMGNGFFWLSEGSCLSFFGFWALFPQRKGLLNLLMAQNHSNI